jgi:hypothetical protein
MIPIPVSFLVFSKSSQERERGKSPIVGLLQ